MTSLAPGFPSQIRLTSKAYACSKRTNSLLSAGPMSTPLAEAVLPLLKVTV